MRILILLIVFTSFGAVAYAQAQPHTPDKERAVAYAGRNLVLEKDALAQRKKIDSMLPQCARQRLNGVFKSFIKRLLRESKPVDLSTLVNEEMARQFADLSPEQSNVLSFYLLTGVIELIPPHSTRKEEESMGEMNEMDMLMLQQMMEKKSQLEQMISNIMKAGFEGGQAAIQSLKAS